MTGNYPDPFGGGTGPTCELTCNQILGPCYSGVTSTRMDVSEGKLGLPTRLAFLVLDERCRPIPNAVVDIWHSSAEGLYSGRGVDQEPHGQGNARTCTLGNADALRSTWFRGLQSTNANGRADFNTCFPGWYSGRTIHIHVIVRVNRIESETTQLYFQDALSDEIIATQPVYNARGRRDTTNRTDGIARRIGAQLPKYMFQTRRMDDGAMLAWKALIVRPSGVGVCRVG